MNVYKGLIHETKISLNSMYQRTVADIYLKGFPYQFFPKSQRTRFQIIPVTKIILRITVYFQGNQQIMFFCVRIFKPFSTKREQITLYRKQNLAQCTTDFPVAFLKLCFVM